MRHGGRLYSVHPYLIAAERGLDEILPRIPELVAHARELGTALAALDGIEIVPDPPQTTMFHLDVHRPLEPLQEAAFEQAEQTGTFLGFIRATDRPEVQRLELTIGPASLEVPVAKAKALWAELPAFAEQPRAPDGKAAGGSEPQGGVDRMTLSGTLRRVRWTVQPAQSQIRSVRPWCGTSGAAAWPSC